MSLYQKYRPETFDDVLGNESEVQSFEKMLNKKDRPHVYLLTGPSGCGKTTLARIAAKHLGADDSIATTEMNSADNRGIDTAREIIQQIGYVPPTKAGVRVFIIDELHQTSKDWQNAMLKPLEDTPKHVYFFLCTTDPKKLIAALKNRCTQIKVASQNSEDLYRYMRKITKKESLEIPKEILEEISENCNGSPRQALVLLEKISELKDPKAMKEIISMGDAAEKETIELCRALLNSNSWKEVSGILKKLKDQEPENVRYAVLGYMNSVLLNSGNTRAAVVIELFQDNYYSSGKAGLTLSCFQVFSEQK